MINDHPDAEEDIDYAMSEFFVMYKYRRSGIGHYAALEIFDHFRGKWQLKRHPKNLGSVKFWDRIIAEHTNENYQLIEGHTDAEFEDGTLGDVFFFDNSKTN